MFTKRLNRTYTISKENNANGGGPMERQMWDKQYNVSNVGLSPNLNSNDKKILFNDNEIPAWVECASEKP